MRWFSGFHIRSVLFAEQELSRNFDAQSKTEESEGEPHDYVTIFKDETCTDHWGPSKRIGGMDADGWPGANGPGFTIPGEMVVVHLRKGRVVATERHLPH